jgi:hypothetical protein
VNKSYLVIADDVTRTNTSLQYAVSTIHGNNGNNQTLETAMAGTQTATDGAVLTKMMTVVK